MWPEVREVEEKQLNEVDENWDRQHNLLAKEIIIPKPKG